MSFVILLSTNSKDFYLDNDYGYYAGKTYTVNRIHYPYFDKQITERTKRYKSEIVALSVAKRIFEKCPHVLAYKVENCSY